MEHDTRACLLLLKEPAASFSHPTPPLPALLI